MTTRTGDRRHRFRVQAFTKSKNAIGETVQVWTDVLVNGRALWVWARKTNKLSATAEAVVAGAEVAKQTVQLDMRPRDLDTTMRLVDSAGTIWDIRSFGPSNDGRDLAVIATSNGEKVT